MSLTEETRPTITTGSSVGKPLDRVDGRLKVTGGARYSAEMPIVNVAHAVLIMSTIAKGRIASMDTKAAEQLPGVRLILTPFNAPEFGHPRPVGAAPANPRSHRPALLHEDIVRFNNQPIGVVVADTLEQARHAAEMVQVHYTDVSQPAIDLHKGALSTPHVDSHRGDPDAGRKQATNTIESTYSTPMEFHSPIEPHATIAVWEGMDKLTVYDATQGIFGVRGELAQMFELDPANVRCVSYFVGGGFGCKGSMWAHVPLAALAARQVGRPVKLVLTRTQMFGPIGYRPQTEQKMLFGADASGAITISTHDVISNTSTYDDFVEGCAGVTRMLYVCPNQTTSHQTSRLDVGAPTWMRAPGESSGTWALESVMDELAYATKLDPIALRLKNYAETDPGDNRPFSSKSLKECYRIGAEKFRWERRNPTPRSMRSADGRLLGMGMATATYPAFRGGSSALARLLPDGTAHVEAGSQDIGTGTYTIMTQIAADALGLPPEKVRFELGDTKMPETPGSGGSMTAATTGNAVLAAGQAARLAAITLAIADSASPLHGLAAADVDVQNGRLVAKSDATRGEEYAALIKRSGKPSIEARVSTNPGQEQWQHSSHSFGAVFAEVWVDPDLGEIRLARLTGVYGAGKILNAKTAHSQLVGGMIFGAGMALLEQGMIDPRYGRILNADLAEYHLPVNADIPPIEVVFVDEVDTNLGPLGAKGIGEIGTTGVVAAIGNAVYHATGVRVRDLPITLDKVLKSA